MENASKALLIAGAILVCILLIGVGMLVFQSIGGTVDEGISQISTQERDIFNKKFTTYEGNSVNGSNVRALIDRVRDNNSQLEEAKGPKYVAIDGDARVTGTTIEDKKKINTAQMYTVTTDDTNGDGLIDIIHINLKQTKTNNP